MCANVHNKVKKLSAVQNARIINLAIFLCDFNPSLSFTEVSFKVAAQNF